MFQTQGFWSEKSREGAARMAWPVGLLAIVAAVGGCGNEKDAASGTGTETGTGTGTETENSAPVAVSGAPQTVDEGTLVFLDGSGSSDPEGDELTYLWSQKEGRKAELSDPNATNPSFIAPGGMSADERFSFALVVNDGELSSGESLITVTVRAARPSDGGGFLPTMAALLAKGRFTLNNTWTQEDLDFENISAPLAYGSITGVWQWVRPYTTTVTEYEARRRQCEEDSTLLHQPDTYTVIANQQYQFQDRKCYPTLQLANNLSPMPLPGTLASQVLHRYGYYCGAKFGAGRDSFSFNTPEPLDGVDYCCRLHDRQTWGKEGWDYSNECGIAMCLRQATVKGIAALPPDVEEARQHWYGDSVAGGATTVCPGNQSNNARAPVGE